MSSKKHKKITFVLTILILFITCYNCSIKHKKEQVSCSYPKRPNTMEIARCLARKIENQLIKKINPMPIVFAPFCMLNGKRNRLCCKMEQYLKTKLNCTMTMDLKAYEEWRRYRDRVKDNYDYQKAYTIGGFLKDGQCLITAKLSSEVAERIVYICIEGFDTTTGIRHINEIGALNLENPDVKADLETPASDTVYSKKKKEEKKIDNSTKCRSYEIITTTIENMIHYYNKLAEIKINTQGGIRVTEDNLRRLIKKKLQSGLEIVKLYIPQLNQIWIFQHNETAIYAQNVTDNPTDAIIDIVVCQD